LQGATTTFTSERNATDTDDTNEMENTMATEDQTNVTKPSKTGRPKGTTQADGREHNKKKALCIATIVMTTTLNKRKCMTEVIIAAY